MPTATKEKTTIELSAIYDRIYDIADRLIKKHNPCNIHIETIPHHLYPTKLNEETVCMSYSINSLCCGECKYWDKGCTVKSLGCKLFLCQYIKNKTLQKRFRRLRDYSIKHLSFTYYDTNWKQKRTYLIASRYYAPKEDWLKEMENKL